MANVANDSVVFDVRHIPVEGFLDDSISSDSKSFVHKKYNEGRPNGSLDATEKGSKESLNRMLDSKEPEVFFGSRIKETARQLHALFG